MPSEIDHFTNHIQLIAMITSLVWGGALAYWVLGSTFDLGVGDPGFNSKFGRHICFLPCRIWITALGKRPTLRVYHGPAWKQPIGLVKHPCKTIWSQWAPETDFWDHRFVFVWKVAVSHPGWDIWENCWWFFHSVHSLCDAWVRTHQDCDHFLNEITSKHHSSADH